MGNIKNQFLRSLPKDKLARANFLVRLRMSILYYYATIMNRLVLDTGNKSELKLGYFTKYGDATIDLMPLGDLYNTEVRDLAEFIEIPMKISRKVAQDCGDVRQQKEKSDYHMRKLILFLCNLRTGKQGREKDCLTIITREIRQSMLMLPQFSIKKSNQYTINRG